MNRADVINRMVKEIMEVYGWSEKAAIRYVKYMMEAKA